MQFLSTLLALVASASAIDIHLRYAPNCGTQSGGFVCTAVNPNSCCGISTGGVASIAFLYIPLDWSLDLRGHEGGNCGPVKSGETVLFTNFKCMAAGPYTGAGYSFRGSKVKRVAAALSCTEQHSPDHYVDAEGKKYALANLTANELATFVEKVGNGTVPEAYKTLQFE